MKQIKHISKSTIIIGLLITGIGSCAVATTKTGNSGFDGIIPALIGWLCITFALIFLIIDLTTKWILKLRESRNEEVKTNLRLTSYSSELNKILILSLITFLAHWFAKYFIFGIKFNFSTITSIMIIIGLLASYIGLKHKKKQFRIIWLVLLTFLLLDSVYVLSLSLLSFKLWYILILAVPVTYFYCIKVILKLNEKQKIILIINSKINL
ncbi:MAG: hypothetical protein IPG00_07275 [Saprospiraceae bacterium]|nr:hypothetical protein [Saprospiraceae bacterium]